MNSGKAKSDPGNPPIPPPRILPGMDLSLARIARQVAHHASPILRANQALLLTMTIDTRDESAPLWIGFWDSRCTLNPLPIHESKSTKALAVLTAAANVLLADLIRRWPVNAVPPAVGIFTDGSGVAFSSDHPSPLSTNWLVHHQAGLCPTTTLVPFSPNGAWSRLIAPAAEPLIH
ncbi:hypothetical protein AB5I39_13185 [Sphingomonas sp. MMS24-J45]|uniref:hypothetical protein n=1 Tax=Sphingomonas sp. MMS24-J45 TaxID=3238806 RepID=UPI003850D0BB